MFPSHDQSKKFKNFIVAGGSDRFDYDNPFQFLSKKSSYLDVNYTNFLEVLRIVTGKQ